VSEFWSSKCGLNWRAAALLGLISSTFSTLVSQFTAARIGRDAAVDWMVVASIPLREGVLQVEPSWPVILAGILFHQWADVSWAVVFFGLLGRWTAGLSPWAILLLAAPWAFFTSAAEWLFLVPLLPFWQPIFPLDQPYWIGFLVHWASASMYPIFPWLRDWTAGHLPSPHRRFAAVWSSLAAFGVLALGFVAFLGWQNREPPWIGTDPGYDQAYMRRMKAHHAQGVELARLAAQKAEDPHVMAMSRLIAAVQNGEIAVFEQWWRSWFDGPLPEATPDDHAVMPGMLSREELERFGSAQGAEFDRLFVGLMTSHHQGAIAMADEALRKASDPRLKLMAHSIRHAQRGEIELMYGTEGLAAVEAAIAALWLPARQHPTDRQRGAGPLEHHGASVPQ
jgi:uncharacterized protein (DUF305 family)